MDPTSVISNIFSAIKIVIDMLDSLKENAIRSTQLLNRVRRIQECLQGMESQAIISKLFVFQQILECFTECEKCIKEFYKRNWLMKVIKTKSLNAELEGLNQQLGECVNDLNLAINSKISNVVLPQVPPIPEKITITPSQLVPQSLPDTPEEQDSFQQVLQEMKNWCVPFLVEMLQNLEIPNFVGDLSSSEFGELGNFAFISNSRGSFAFNNLKLSSLLIKKECTVASVSEQYLVFRTSHLTAAVNNFQWMLDAKIFKDQGKASAILNDCTIEVTFEVKMKDGMPALCILQNSVFIDNCNVTISHQDKSTEMLYNSIVELLNEKVSQAIQQAVEDVISAQFQVGLTQELKKICASYLNDEKKMVPASPNTSQRSSGNLEQQIRDMQKRIDDLELRNEVLLKENVAVKNALRKFASAVEESKHLF